MHGPGAQSAVFAAASVTTKSDPFFSAVTVPTTTPPRFRMNFRPNVVAGYADKLSPKISVAPATICEGTDIRADRKHRARPYQAQRTRGAVRLTAGLLLPASRDCVAVP